MGTRIAIIGAGGVGAIVGGFLTKAGQDVTLVDQWPEHVEAMRTKGLHLGGTSGEHVVPVKALHIHELQAVSELFDLVFIAVKSYDTEWATALGVAYLATPDGIVVDFQNGMNDARVASIAGRERTLGCVITIGVALIGPAHAIRTDSGSLGFRIGELDGRETDRARKLVELMHAVAPAKLTRNVMGERWSKLAVNCMANPLAALSGLGSAEVRSEREPCLIAIQVASEVIRVGRAAGFEIEPIYGIAPDRYVEAAQGRGVDEVHADMAAGSRFLSGGRPSMLQDVLKGRRTEIEYLNGLVSAEGRRVGVPTPFNDAVVRVVTSLGVGRLKPDRKNLEPLVAILPRR